MVLNRLFCEGGGRGDITCIGIDVGLDVSMSITTNAISIVWCHLYIKVMLVVFGLGGCSSIKCPSQPHMGNSTQPRGVQ